MENERRAHSPGFLKHLAAARGFWSMFFFMPWPAELYPALLRLEQAGAVRRKRIHVGGDIRHEYSIA
jgi:hypothetical protein